MLLRCAQHHEGTESACFKQEYPFLRAHSPTGHHTSRANALVQQASATQQDAITHFCLRAQLQPAPQCCPPLMHNTTLTSSTTPLQPAKTLPLATLIVSNSRACRCSSMRLSPWLPVINYQNILKSKAFW